MFKDYFVCREWLEGFIPYTYSKENLGLERIEYLLNLLGNPQNKFKSILVAGTSGKGSTAFYIAKLLQFSENSVSQKVGKLSKSESRSTGNSDKIDIQTHRYTESSEYSGLKIGLHISPHLSYVGERMQINGKAVPPLRFVKLINEIRPFVESMKGSKVGLPSYFEILVAASFLYFALEKVDWAVVEVGLGGRLDATNVLKPEVSVITNVGLDHMEILGNTLEKIALEKSGIIKQKTLVVTGATGKALKIIEKVAKDKKSTLINVGTLFSKSSLKSDILNYLSNNYDIERYRSNLVTSTNFLLALAAVLSQGLVPERQATLKVNKIVFSGRLEQVSKNVIIDGAHNANKIRFLIDFIRKLQITNYKIQIILVVAFKKGKSWKKMVDLLVKNLPVKKVIATEFYAVTDTGRFSAVDSKEIAKYVKSKSKLKVESLENSQEAVLDAIDNQKDDELVLVTGSLYLVGEARTLWYLPSI